MVKVKPKYSLTSQSMWFRGVLFCLGPGLIVNEIIQSRENKKLICFLTSSIFICLTFWSELKSWQRPLVSCRMRFPMRVVAISPLKPIQNNSKPRKRREVGECQQSMQSIMNFEWHILKFMRIVRNNTFSLTFPFSSFEVQLLFLFSARISRAWCPLSSGLVR